MFGVWLAYLFICKSFLRMLWTGLLQAGPMEEGIPPQVASERLAMFQV